MKLKLNWILALFLTLSFAFSYGQEKQVTGTVKDTNGMPLPGVNILVKGTNNGVDTDFDGKYSIKARTGDVLVFSYLGMKTVEETVGSSAVINVSMEEDAQVLEGVVITGYSKKAVSEVTGSLVQVDGEAIENLPVVSVDQALQGKVAGLQISTTSGTPGSAQDIRIRGMGSITASNQPLFVIDGVPVINTNLSGSSAVSSLNPLSSINSKDIESITVLKEASATAQYGARGSNGVIVITTKRGKAGRTTFNFSSSVGFQNDAYNKRDPLTAAQKAELLGESVYNSYGEDFGFTPDEALDFAAAYQLGGGFANWDGTSEYDWPGLLTNDDAVIQNYSLSASGGTDVSNFYASLSMNKTEATVIGPAFERVTGLVSYSAKLNEKMNFETSANVSYSKQNPILEQGSYFNNPFITRYLMTPFANPYNDDGTYNTTNLGTSIFNTLYTMDNDITRNTLLRAISNSKFNYEIIDGLVFETRISLDFNSANYKAYRNRYHGDGDDVGGYSEASNIQNYNWVSQNSLKYNFAVDQHNFDVMALFEYQKNQYNYLYGYGENFSTDGLTNIASAGANFDATSSFSDWYNVSYLGVLNYNYAGKYVFDATFRREASSRFANGYRWGNFGSVGAAWNIYREDFMKDSSIFNELRLRGSYGITGNSGIGVNTYQALLSYDADYAGNGAVYPSQLGNELLTWEKAHNLDVGVDFALLNNKISGAFAYYQKNTYDLLQLVPLSQTTGFDEQNQNVGKVNNSGIELELNFDVLKTEDFSWTISGNIATVKNEVTELALDSEGNELDPNAGSSYKRTVVGGPIGEWYMRTWAGVDPDTGDPTWYLNGVDGEVTSNYSAAARVSQGASALPKYTAGLNTHFEYKGAFLDASFYFAGGHKVYEQYAQFYMRTNSFSLGTYNGVAELLDRWQQPGDITNVPRLEYGVNDNFHATSSRHLYDGDYIRLRNVTLGYNLPSSLIEKIGFDAATFTIQGTNLVTWVKDDLKLDPEVSAAGYTTLTTPPVKSVVLGVNLKF